MYAEERRQEIVSLARADGRVSVADVASRFDVTTETIRRDLEVLDRSGLLRRVHGGAIPSEFHLLGDLAMDDRQVASSAEKDRIAAAAMRLLQRTPQATIILDAGTTTGRLASLLPVESGFVVVTNSLPAASALSARSRGEVQLLGGRVRGITQACVGIEAIARLQKLRADIAFMGTNGVSLEHGLSTPDADEAAVKAQMVRSAHRVVVLTDSRKLGAETTTRFAEIEDIDVLITDAGITPSMQQKLKHRGVEVIVA